MARCKLNSVKKSRKENRCGRCGETLPVGSPYLWWQFRFGGPYIRCTESTCYPKPYELESNGRIRELEEGRYTAQQGICTATSTDDLVTALRDFSSVVESVKGQYEESMEAMPEQFQGTSDVYCDMEDRVNEYDEWMGELESVADDIEDEEPPEGEGEDVDEEATETWFEELRERADDVLNSY